MFVDVAIVLIAFIVALGAGVVTLRPKSLLRRLIRPRLWTLPELRPQVTQLLNWRAEHASLAVSPRTPGRSFGVDDTLTLMKYDMATGESGLHCEFPAHLHGASFAPAAGRYSPRSGWSDLAAFISRHKIRISERTSRPDAHYTETFHRIQLDFGSDAEAAADFMEFFFRDMLLLRVQTFTCRRTGIEPLRRLLGARWWGALGKFGAPTGDLKDLHLMMVQLLGLTGLAYSLAFAGADWPGIHATILDHPITVRTFDVAFMMLFVWSAFGNVIIRRAKRFVLPISAILLVLLINASHKIMIWAMRAEIAIRTGKPRELVAPESSGFYEHFLASQIPTRLVRDASVGILLAGALICIATVIRWGAPAI